MTATTMSNINKPRRYRGFTIASLIGSDSDAQTEKLTESPIIDSVPKTNLPGKCSRRREHDSDSDTDKNSDSVMERKERDILQTQILLHNHERLRMKEFQAQSDLDSSMGRRTSSSLHRDSVRDFNFSSASVREGVRAPASPDTLRHLHESFLQNGALNAGANSHIHLGNLDTQRHFRHPMAGAGIPGFPAGQMPMGPQLHPMLMGGGRDLRHLYPYMADRYPGCFLPRYGMGGMPGLFFQPYRKPKRIRTAFSPSQLLQLEKSFEKSHYVVGQERKDLANELQLTETQVKVWFQNRRTKYKRSKGEHDGSGSGDDRKSPFNDSKDESDVSDSDEIDDVGDEYPMDTYQHAIQTC
ncbi:homeobox protein Nkx-3.1-like [Dreissena polymorpha]|uniref:Homeobox domain-containing protein n=1 Tax=Dreissena polymorpha TaxID=45954 RepID=A0A9D4IWB4_DREPO|nr:homeobox protein Nkx-3.1-like [Dreissena polymorpha]KAH3786573.1 hypothetical protein DPMN_164680 [Dreissena polymorpha]